MILGVMTQPLRVKYAAAHLGRDGSDAVLVTVESADFSLSPLADTVALVTVGPPSTTTPTDRVVRGRLGRRVLRWARSGSSLGRRAERLVRKVLWRLRPRPAATPAAGGYRPPAAVVAAVGRALDDHDITEIVCFDAFDLVAVDAALVGRPDADLPVRIR